MVERLLLEHLEDLERLLPVLGVDAVSESLGDGARPSLGVGTGVQPLLDVLEGSPWRP
uniref:Uncharacterized protein n=1 Tax=Arundo donax TaxID=35708 RepID=A0A0A9ABB7_ARUDO